MMNILYYFDTWMSSWAEWGWFGITLIFIMSLTMIIIGILLLVTSRGFSMGMSIKLMVTGVIVFVIFNIVCASLFGFKYEAFLQWYFQEFFL